MSKVEIRTPIYDKFTGKNGVYVELVDNLDGMEYLWRWGNWGCDCNRGLRLADALNEPDDSELNEVECGEQRFYVPFFTTSTGERVFIDVRDDAVERAE